MFFLVENRRFALPRLVFEKNSDYFEAVLANHGSSSESNPVILDDVEVTDFESFLGVLCPLQFDPVTTPEAWLSVLTLATKWSFDTIRYTAIRELTTIISPIDKIVLGRRYDVLEWLEEAYLTICRRPQALSIEEGEKLGLKEAILISQVRQEVRTWERLRSPKEIITTVKQSLLKSWEGGNGLIAIFPNELSDGVPLMLSGGSKASGAYAPYADAFLGHSAERDAPVKSEWLRESSISSISQQRSSRRTEPRAASAAHTLQTMKEGANNGNAPGPTTDPGNPFASMGSGLSGYAPSGKARSSRRKVSCP
ncbi:hypothetical protein JAAARDRAFT_33720 [Jaapia argillacea MUCL 33604]|uniref:BTB domain-containing protein n=1 Tax=Jaapia argillacea MUCL 33604 TaxID=933084 RepID=A0A067Q692_9AGAM|nr:hypothetical protein JAAARDRAFT_33720 [Jaapia argillacea MUCL 33604]